MLKLWPKQPLEEADVRATGNLEVEGEVEIKCPHCRRRFQADVLITTELLG